MSFEISNIKSKIKGFKNKLPRFRMYFIRCLFVKISSFNFPKIKLPIIRIDFKKSIVLTTLIMVTFVFIMAKWSSNSEEMSRLRKIQSKEAVIVLHLREAKLKSEQYSRIYEALKFMTFNRMTKEQLKSVTEELWIISRRLNFDPLLVLALVSVESQGNPSIQGRYRSGKVSGALGLMQIKESTAKFIASEAGVKINNYKDLLKPELNLIVGTHYLVKLIYSYKSLRLGIVAYNIGPGALNIKLRNRVSLPKKYYNRILSNYQALTKRFGENPSIKIAKEASDILSKN